MIGNRTVFATVQPAAPLNGGILRRETESPFFLRSYRFSAHNGRPDRVHCSEGLLWLVVHQMTPQVFKSADETSTADLGHGGLKGVNLSETSFAKHLIVVKSK